MTTNTSKHTATYSFRAECLDDIDTFLRLCEDQGINFSSNVRPGVYQVSDPDVEMQAAASLEQLQDIMRRVEDGHVMLQTLRACPRSENSLERDYDLTFSSDEVNFI